MVLEQEVRTKDRIVRELQRQVGLAGRILKLGKDAKMGTVEDVMYIIMFKMIYIYKLTSTNSICLRIIMIFLCLCKNYQNSNRNPEPIGSLAISPLFIIGTPQKSMTQYLHTQ